MSNDFGLGLGLDPASLFPDSEVPPVADATAGERFREAMDRDRPQDDSSSREDRDERRDDDKKPAEPATEAPPPHPFSLFARLPDPAPTASAPPAPRVAELAEALAERIMVGGADGGRREVRVALKQEVLPRTELRIYEVEGALQVDFHCDDPSTQAWLAQSLAPLAEQLGQRLRREVRLRLREGEEAGPAREEAADDGAGRVEAKGAIEGGAPR